MPAPQRTLTVLQHLSLDGVVQGPGSRDEDPSEGFDRGGWTEPYGGDDLGRLILAKIRRPIDLLLGRKTYLIWSGHWPHHQDVWPESGRAVKYVVSNSLKEGPWPETRILSGDPVEQVRSLKATEGPPLHTWGSSKLVPRLLAAGLVDTLWLIVYPVVVGKGKRLFAEGAPLSGFRLVSSVPAGQGAVVLEYEKAES